MSRAPESDSTPSYRPGVFLHVAPAVLYVVAIFYMGSSTQDPLAGLDFDLKDKVGHAVAFAGMQVTQVRAQKFLWPAWSAKRLALTSTLTAIAFGGLLEIWQAALPHRTAEWGDFIADAIGAVVAGLVWWRMQRERA